MTRNHFSKKIFFNQITINQKTIKLPYCAHNNQNKIPKNIIIKQTKAVYLTAPVIFLPL